LRSPLRRMPESQIRRRVEETAEKLRINHLLQRKTARLSGGEMQRVSIGRAIVREPRVFLMDEPLSNLDAKLRVQARGEISKLHMRLGTTFIYVTHDQTEAMTMGTRIAVLKDGILQQIDTPQSLYDLPGNIFVAGFIGSPAMNFFDATLIEENGVMYADCRDFRVAIPEERRSMYKSYLGKEVVFGIRPEHVHDPDYPLPGIVPALVEGRVDVTELMGNEVLTYFTLDHAECSGRFDPRTKATIGTVKAATFDMSRMHLFDKQTESAIR